MRTHTRGGKIAIAHITDEKNYYTQYKHGRANMEKI